MRLQGSPPSIDGRLDEAVWTRTVFADRFVQREPREGAPAVETTAVAFCYDDEALYIGARMHSTDPGAIRALASRRDREGGAEQLIVSLDTYFDRRTAYAFAVTAAGVRLDYHHPVDAEDRREYSFDPVWDARVSRTAVGWTAEMRIPFSQLRFNRGTTRWGLNVSRRVPARNEESFWVLIPKQETGWASRFGDLVGLEEARAPARIELVPYVSGSAVARSGVDAANPFDEAREAEGGAGADVKIGLGSDFTLDVTVNPDFGQVEADPAEVNLTAFETFFTERRSFFVEGGQLFQTRGPWFYSRRIGGEPRGPATGDFVDRPSGTTILAAAKLTGRRRSGLSIAALGGVTGREHARTFASAEAAFGRVEVQPPAAFGVLRMQQQFGSNASTAGFILTALDRRLDRGSLLASVLPRRALGASADWTLRFKGGQYEIDGYGGFSFVEGDPAAIRALQESSAHYFQRPDARHLRLDSTRDSLGGWAAATTISRNSGRHWLWSVNVFGESPGLATNDLGRLGSTDDAGLYATLRFRETQPGRLHGYEAGLTTYNEWNFGGDRQSTFLEPYAIVTWRNFWRSAVYLALNARSFSADLTRGGPLMQTAANWTLRVETSNGTAPRTQWKGEGSYRTDELGGWNATAKGTITFQPGDRWAVTLAPSVSRQRDSRQYVTTIPRRGPETFGRRYVFAFIDRATLSAQMRFNYALTPDLTLESHFEPFAASGRYFDHGELAAPRTHAVIVYGRGGTTAATQPDGSLAVEAAGERFTIRNLDFNVRSFRSNVVLRWEWRRGSTAYLVWQQDRVQSRPDGRLVGPGGLWDALTAPGSHVLALKISYWIPLG